jgi:hypothetical protein
MKISMQVHQKTRNISALAVHSYTPSHLGSRDQEDCGSKPAKAKSS